MIIVRTPLRVSFFGGGTDHPKWYLNHGKGAVLSTTINKYVYVMLRNLPAVFDFNYRIAWRIVEQAKKVDEIENPVIREIFRNYCAAGDCGLELTYNADLPARSGLGSSSAFAVAALHALFRHQGKAVTRKQLALDAIQVEQGFLGEPVGCQDQTAVAHGGLNRIDFLRNGEICVRPIEMSRTRRTSLEQHLIMFFTGFTRDAGSIERQKLDGIADRTRQLARMYEMVGEGEALLMNDAESSLRDFGVLLGEAWQEKRSLAGSVTSGPIDEIYDAGVAAGAFGGKLLGAGGGGFLLFFAPRGVHAAIVQSVSKVDLGNGKRPIHIPFELEDEGSRVILHQPELTSNYESLPVHSRIQN